MFALPNAKRVRRDELYATSDVGSASSGQDSDGNNDAAAALFRQRMSGLLDLSLDDNQADPQTLPVVDDTTQTPKTTDDEGGFEFNLFAPASRPQPHQPVEQPLETGERASPTQKTDEQTPRRQRIRLTPPPGLDAAGYPTDYKYIRQQRPQSYYFTSAYSDIDMAKHQRQFKVAAIDAGTLLKQARTPWPDGHILDTRRPWRISVWLPSERGSSTSAAQYRSAEDASTPKRRSRAGKKTRIRRRVQAAKTAQKAADKQRRREEEAQREADKEEHLRRKKSEMNRKKQIRKREKERERKAAADAVDAPQEN